MAGALQTLSLNIPDTSRGVTEELVLGHRVSKRLLWKRTGLSLVLDDRCSKMQAEQGRRNNETNKLTVKQSVVCEELVRTCLCCAMHLGQLSFLGDLTVRNYDRKV